MKILVTGAAGFIGFHVSKKLISKSINVVGFDNINEYYETDLKLARLNQIEQVCKKENKANYWDFIKGDLEDISLLKKIFEDHKPDIVIHLAAQAGVRYSLKNPISYINSNLVGFSNILECCRQYPVKNLIYASSSSVYGGNKKLPFSEKDPVDHPVSLYAATKKSNELMAHTYSHLYKIPATGLRFFTVYGPWGRPDMAPMIFTKAILSNQPIKIFNNGKMARDFTYIDDIVKTIIILINKPAIPNNDFDYYSPEPNKSWCEHQIFNIGNSNSIKLMDFIKILEQELGIEAKKQFVPMQDGDVEHTAADTTAIQNWTGFKPNTSLVYGIKKFTSWYKGYYSN